ncbi:MAG: DUF411 domain-containing protein [Bacteroidota bacterium]
MRALLLLLPLALVACQPATDSESVASTEPTPAEATTALASAPVQLVSDAPTLTVYKSPTCGCCSLWADHMEAAGFDVVSIDRTDMDVVKDSLGVPQDIASCHTATVGDYVVEGHVPAEQVARLLDEEPEVRGLSVPGMPIGSPGMEVGDRRDAYDVLVVGQDGEAAVYASIPGNAAP